VVNYGFQVYCLFSYGYLLGNGTLSAMKSLTNKHVLLGICGSIAAYKSAELTRKLRDAGADVRVVMTHSAEQFITPLTLQALSGHPVHSDLLDTDTEAAMGHIELARWADLILIAPASADFIARLSQGRANDLLTAICLASQTTIALAPAMNQAMWSNQATQQNVATLKNRQLRFVGPVDGLQACGELGEGRMMEPAEILENCQQLFQTGQLAGKRLIITAGPTREAIDPVRYLSNRSSGKMGFAVAEAAVEAGAKVILISGPVNLPTPDRVNRVDVVSAADMHQAVNAHLSECDIFISAAAVADYRPGLRAVSKIKKQDSTLNLSLVKTPDILASIGDLKNPPFTVGFAAETGQVLDYARDKLQRKNLDMIVANQVGDTMGFDSEDNTVDILWADGHIHLPLDSKKTLASKLISIIAERFNANHSTKNSGQKTWS